MRGLDDKADDEMTLMALHNAVWAALELLRDRRRALAQELKQVEEAVSALERVAEEGRHTDGLGSPRSTWPDEGRVDRTLKGLSYPEAAAVILREAGKPLHVDTVVERFQRRGYQADYDRPRLKSSVIGALARKARAGETFTREGRGYYGLLDWSAQTMPDPHQMKLIPDGLKPMDAILLVTERHPGIKSIEVADQIQDRIATASPNPRKVVLTLISQLVGSGRLLKSEDGGLYPVSTTEEEVSSEPEPDPQITDE